MIVSKWVVTDKLSIEIGGNWHYKIFGRIVLRSKLYYYRDYGTPIFLDDCFELGGDGQTVDWNWRELSLQNFRADCFEE